MPATIWAMCWSGMSGRLPLQKSENVAYVAVAEQEELAVVLPRELAAAQQPPVRVEHLDVRRVAVVLEHDLVGLVLVRAPGREAR